MYQYRWRQRDGLLTLQICVSIGVSTVGNLCVLCMPLQQIRVGIIHSGFVCLLPLLTGYFGGFGNTLSHQGDSNGLPFLFPIMFLFQLRYQRTKSRIFKINTCAVAAGNTQSSPAVIEQGVSLYVPKLFLYSSSQSIILVSK